MGAKVGYVRVSSIDQSCDRQLNGLELDKVFEDKASGKDTKRPGLTACLEYLREGDWLVIHSMDRASRNLGDLEKLVDGLNGKGVTVQFIKENLTFAGDDTPMARLQLQMMGAFAQFERSMIKERQREGISVAKAAGKHLGRAPKLSPDKVDELKRRAAAGETKASLATEFGVSRQSIFNYLKA
jgi:DNA invertase Pin-like site-specific DNA recombinase